MRKGGKKKGIKKRMKDEEITNKGTLIKQTNKNITMKSHKKNKEKKVLEK